MLLTETAYERRMVLPSHSHGSSHVAILLEGCYLERVGDRSYLCLPGDALHYSPDVLHDNLFGNHPGRCLNIEFPDGDTTETRWDERSLTAWEPGVMVSRQSKVDAPPTWVSQVRDWIVESPVRSLSSLAEASGVHRSHLARCFRRAFGQSVGQFVKIQRTRIAARQLIETSAPLPEIAFECGFFDQSHFTNTFSEVTGFTPGGLRSIVHG